MDKQTMKTRKEKNFNDKLKKAMLKKEHDLLEGVKIGFMHFDENGKIDLLDNLENINWIEYDKDKKM